MVIKDHKHGICFDKTSIKAYTNMSILDSIEYCDTSVLRICMVDMIIKSS